MLREKFLQCFSYKIFPNTHTVYRLIRGGVCHGIHGNTLTGFPNFEEVSEIMNDTA